MVLTPLLSNTMKQKNFTVSCIVNVFGLQIIILKRLSPQTHSLPEGLGYVHIGQVYVGRSELSAHILNVLFRKRLIRKCTKRGMTVCRVPNSTVTVTLLAIAIALLLEAMMLLYYSYVL